MEAELQKVEQSSPKQALKEQCNNDRTEISKRKYRLESMLAVANESGICPDKLFLFSSLCKDKRKLKIFVSIKNSILHIEC